MPLEIVTVPCLRDNYAYLLHDAATGTVGLVDAPEAAAIEAALKGKGWALDLILITHHHGDHIDGVEALRKAHGAKVAGAAADSRRLPPLDIALAEGDTVAVGESVAQVLDVPGHTVGHIAYWFEADRALFSADSLMVMGCGRLFEGTPGQMWESLMKMSALPDDTLFVFRPRVRREQHPFRAERRRRERGAEGAGEGHRCDAADGGRDRAGAARPRAGDEPLPAGAG